MSCSYDWDLSSFLFIRTSPRFKLWNYYFYRFELETKIMKKTFLEKMIGSLNKQVDLFF